VLRVNKGVLVLMLMLTIVLSCGHENRAPSPMAKDGVMDLSGWNFAGQGAVTLVGEWRYIPSQFIDPALVPKLWQRPSETLLVPGFWRQGEFAEAKLSNTGFGSYMLKVLLNKESGEFVKKALRVEAINTAAVTYVVDHDNVQHAKLVQGRPGRDKAKELPRFIDGLEAVGAHPASELYIIMHISNFHAYRGGLIHAPTLGSMKELKQDKLRELVTSIFLIGALAIISLYHLIIFLQRTEEKASFAFFFFCSVVAVREILMNRLLQRFEAFSSAEGFNLLFCLEYLTVALGPMACGLFVGYMVPTKKYKTVFTWIILLPGTLLAIFAVFFDGIVVSSQLWGYQTFVLTSGFACMAHLFIESCRRNMTAVWIGCSLILLLLGVANDILHNQGVIVTGYYSSFAFVGFVLLQSAIISNKLAYGYKKTQLLSSHLRQKNREITSFNENLEKMVEHKTSEIQSLLGSIPQDVLSIKEDGIIAVNTSLKSEAFVGKKVAGEKFKNLIFDHCPLLGDEVDQAWQTILSVIGCHEVAFLMNSDHLPLQIEYIDGPINRMFAITWSPQVIDGLIQSIMVTLLDITAEKKLEKQSQIQHQEILKIGELSAVSESRAHSFLSSSYTLLEEIKAILTSAVSEVDKGQVKIFHINLHTVKGNARTLGLQDIADVIHQVEHRFNQIIADEKEVKLEILQHDIDLVLSNLDDYRRINCEKLNRKSDNNFVSIERLVVGRCFYFFRDLLEQGERQSEIIYNDIKDTMRHLSKSIFEEIPQVFNCYREQAHKIAKDTGREVPEVFIRVPGEVIGLEQKEVLDLSMIHILRNALDHGIETKLERLEKGKKTNGVIVIQADANQEGLTIVFRDDGRGMAIATLLKKGMESGVLTAQSSNLEVAETIFDSGLSTAKNVTQISGRGVGMGAVRRFLVAAGGSIEIVLESEKKDSPGYYNFHFEIFLPFSQYGTNRYPTELKKSG